MSYIIVKHAADGAWESYFEGNPKAGCHLSYSVHCTYTGKQCDIRSSYATPEDAAEDLKKILDANPCGNYDLCRVIS